MTFFSKKVDNIRAEITDIGQPSYKPNNELYSLERFTLTVYSEIKMVLSKVSSKHCVLDPIPTWFIKKLKELFIPEVNKVHY